MTQARHRHKTRPRTLADKAISNAKALYYSLSEPRKLAAARQAFEQDFQDKNEQPLVSVYIPTYNRGEILIERAVASVLAQTYQNFELIIIGDCCTDNTPELVAQIKDPRIRFTNLEKRGKRYPDGYVELHWLAGPVVAANAALKQVTGKWIARIDDDDNWYPHHLETMVRFAQEGNYEFVSSAYEATKHGQKVVIDCKDDNPRIGGTQTWLYRSYLSFFRYNIDCWRKSWNRVNDTDLQDRMYKAGVRMGFHEAVTAYILPRPGEETIGLDAYFAQEEGKKEHFTFKE